MKKLFVLILVAMALIAISAPAFAEHRNIGGVGVRSQPGVWIMTEHGNIGGI